MYCDGSSDLKFLQPHIGPDVKHEWFAKREALLRW